MHETDLGAPDAPPLPRDGDRSDAVAYIATLAEQLRDLARREGFPTLAYFLDMARLEAEIRSREIARHGRSGPGVRRS